MRLSLLLIALLSTIQVHAWASKGHNIAAYIAEQFLTGDARLLIDHVLSNDAGYNRYLIANEDQTLLSSSNAAIWADKFAETEEGRKTRRWHFIQLGKQERDISDKGMENILSREGIVKAIVEQDTLLRDHATTPDNKLKALKFLIHFIPDMTQPYHVEIFGQGAGRRLVEWKDLRPSLHLVWDQFLIEEALARQYGEPNLNAAFYWAKQFADSVKNLREDRFKSRIDSLIGCPSPNLIETCAYRWAVDTAQLHIPSRDFPPDGDLSKRYFLDNIDIVAEQLLKAGVRLALRLNLIFSKKTGFDWLDSK
ncbi:hypothetical protein FRC03_011951 [Tulasnella sp. 419]|nr:hypothetical protein FRC03_011951 [Tulasnella sp. 419]